MPASTPRPEGSGFWKGWGCVLPSRPGYSGRPPRLQAGGWDGRGYERRSRLALRESAQESYAPRPAASPRAPPYSACLLPASPRPQQRSSDAPPSVPVASGSTRSSCASLKFLLPWIGLRERVPVNPVLSAAQGKASAVGSAPPRPLFPCDPRISAASDPSRAGANLWLSRFEERKGRRVTSEPHSRRFLRWGALRGSFSSPSGLPATLSVLPANWGEAGAPRGLGDSSSTAGHSGRASL